MRRPDNTPHTLVFWIIWFALINGLFMIIFFLNGGFPQGANEGDPDAIIPGICVILIVIAMAIRFFIIPKIRTAEQLLPAMLIGLALCEGVGIMGVILIPKTLPQTQLALITAAISSMLVYAPFYAGKRENI
ncbi:MAG: hypothetical protein RL346_1369 [Verrucomicrobiota bacterium]|jgi:hypothetical protein